MTLSKIALSTLALMVATGAAASAPLANLETTTTVQTPVVNTSVQVQSTTTTTSTTGGSNISTDITTPGIDVNAVVTIDANSVVTEEDLTTYVDSQMTTDANLKEVSYTDTTVTVAYKQPAKLFGFISSSLTATAEVQADGTVEVSYPWYAFLYSKTVTAADLETELSSSVSGMVTADTTLTAQAKAQIASRLQAALAASFNATSDISVDVDATSDTSVSY